MKKANSSISVLCFLCFIIFFEFKVLAQQASFFKTYSGNNDFGIGSIDLVHDGGYILGAGDCGFYGCNFTILKVDSLGNEDWRYENNQFNGNTSGYLDNGMMKVKQTFDHGFIGIGFIRTDSVISNYDGLVIKLDSSGAIIWSRSYDFSSSDRFIDLHLESDSTYTIVGKAFNQNLLLKIDNSGDTIWTEVGPTFAYPLYFYPSQVLKLSNTYIVGGSTDSLNTNFGHLTLIKYNSNGHLTGLYNYFDTTSVFEDGYYRLTSDTLLLINSLMKQNNSFTYYSKLWKIDIQGNLVMNSILPFIGKFDSDTSTINIHSGNLVQDSIYIGRYYFTENVHKDYVRFYNPNSLFTDIISETNGNILVCGNQNVFGSVGYLAKATDSAFIGMDELKMALSIELYPNPSNELIHFKINTKNNISEGNYTVDFYNSSGILIKSCRAKDSLDFTINVSSFVKGLYMFSLNSHNNRVAAGKFTIN